MRRPALFALVWLVVCVLLTYGPSAGRGFVADDFGWIYFSRIDSAATPWRLLVEGAPGFYRPLVALSFGLDELLYGLSPAGYAITNLVMALAIVAGIIRVGVLLRLAPVAAVFGAGLWILNFHGISTALLWISGRTSLLTTMFAVFAAVALVRGRSLWAGGLALASLMSKEEPVMLPAIFALWLWIDRRPILAIVRMTWPSFAALAIYLALRARTAAFTPATAPSFYRLSASPDVLLPNALSYLDRSLTFVAAVLALGLLVFARVRSGVAESERQAALKGLVWLVLGFAVTIMIPVRSSLYVVFPTVGSALIGMAAGSWLWRTIPQPRRRYAAAAVFALPLAVLPIHWLRHQTTKRQGMLSSRVLEEVRTASRAPAGIARVVVLDDAGARVNAASAFGAELPRAVELVVGKPVPVELIGSQEPRAASDHAASGQDTLVLRVQDGTVTRVNP
jgi:hypothetical protein